MAKNLVASVYGKNFGVKGFLTREMDDMRKFLEPLVNSVYMEEILIDLEKQRSNPKMFPNVVIFLDETNQISSIDDFMKKR